MLLKFAGIIVALGCVVGCDRDYSITERVYSPNHDRFYYSHPYDVPNDLEGLPYDYYVHN